jgi:hypothetical protein
MTTTLMLDPSRPCQTAGGLLALWMPRGRGRDDLADGLVASVEICTNPACLCTTAELHAMHVDDRAIKVDRDKDALCVTWREESGRGPRPKELHQALPRVATA